MEHKQFWQNEAQLFFRAIFPISHETALEALGEAVTELEALTGSSFSRAFINENALQLARQTAQDATMSVITTSRDLVFEKTANWIESGQPLQALIDDLVPVFGKARAQSIAMTETTRLYAKANVAAWKESGVVTGKRWATANDEIVCPICGPLEGETVGLDAMFSDGSEHPPAHVNCRCAVMPDLEG
jgi:SPP1 gp7 family putative phage head morphogenesis protein